MKVDFYGKGKYSRYKTKIDWDNPTAMVAQLIMLEDKRVRNNYNRRTCRRVINNADTIGGILYLHWLMVLMWWMEMHDWLKAKFLSEIVHIKQPNESHRNRKIPSMKKGGGITKNKRVL